MLDVIPSANENVCQIEPKCKKNIPFIGRIRDESEIQMLASVPEGERAVGAARRERLRIASNASDDKHKQSEDGEIEARPVAPLAYRRAISRRECPLKPLERLVCRIIAEYADYPSGGNAYPSRGTIAAAAALHPDTVTSMTAAAVKMGWLMKKRAKYSIGDRNNTWRIVYQLTVPSDFQVEEPERGAGGCPLIAPESPDNFPAVGPESPSQCEQDFQVKGPESAPHFPVREPDRPCHYPAVGPDIPRESIDTHCVQAELEGLEPPASGITVEDLRKAWNVRADKSSAVKKSRALPDIIKDGRSGSQRSTQAAVDDFVRAATEHLALEPLEALNVVLDQVFAEAAYEPRRRHDGGDGRFWTRSRAQPLRVLIESAATQGRLLEDAEMKLRAARRRPEANECTWWKDRAFVAAISDDEWRRRIDPDGDGHWSLREAGPHPRHPDCVVPRRLVEDWALTDRFNRHGNRQGGTSHDR